MILDKIINTIQLGDCYDIIKQLPDKSIDLVLTDPPYGINADKGVGGFGASPQTAKKYEGEWDAKPPKKEVFDELLRIGKKVIIFGGNYFTDKLPVNGHWIVWDKVGETKFQNPFSDCELCWTNIDKKIVKKYIVKQQGFINDGDDVFHPTQKPYRLITDIINDYTEEGDLILDAFSGSGTICVSAKDNNRRFIGIEINEDYYKKSLERLNGITSYGQTSIFTNFNDDQGNQLTFDDFKGE